MSFPSQIAATFPEAWPAALAGMAAPMVSIPMSPEDAAVLGSYSAGFRAALGDRRGEFFSDGFMAALEGALTAFPGGVMPRTSYCSWKGSMLDNLPLRTLPELMQVITADNRRVGDSLVVMLSAGDPVCLHLREWREIAPWSEFRLFVRRRRVVGVSQYRWQSVFPEIAARREALVATLRAFMAEALPELHMEDVVIDVNVDPDPDAETGLKAWLIELNPFSPATDPCLYSWARGGDFDGDFRFNRTGHAAQR